jgi:hypothetical protein
MPITITCPFCDQPREIPDGFPGKQVKCHKCGSIVPIPAPAEDAAERRGVPAWMIGLLIALAVLALFILGTVAMMAMRSGGD